jgi:hypothetical protein
VPVPLKPLPVRLFPQPLKPPENDALSVTAEEGAEKASYFVIPNEVRNLSGFKSQQKERFLGTQRASE